ncbi:MAG: YccF domain-containing protein [Clostridia bacterium]
MKTIGNILWVIFGGLWTALGWSLWGLLWCCTIVGIPLGKQCFKFAKLSFMPFGKDIVSDNGGAMSFILNIIWCLTTGLTMAVSNVILGLSMCVTIVGIPFGLQYFKLARLSFAPFGFKVR